MTTKEKAKKGVQCHKKRACKSCPYYESDIMLDPRIDPDYNANAMRAVKKCRDELIKDLSDVLEWVGWS